MAEAVEAQAALCRVRRIEVFIEVFPLATQNQVDESRPVLKRFVSKYRQTSRSSHIPDQRLPP